MAMMSSPYDHHRIYMAALPEMAKKLLARGFNGWRAGGLFYMPQAFADPETARFDFEGDGAKEPTILEIDMTQCSEKVFIKPSYVDLADFSLPEGSWIIFGKIPREAFSEHVPAVEPPRSPGP